MVLIFLLVAVAATVLVMRSIQAKQINDEKNLQRIKDEAVREAKEQLKKELKEELGQKNHVRIQQTPELVCPNCGRAHYRVEGGPGDYYCKWCGVVFSGSCKIVPEVIFRPNDYFRNIWDVRNVHKYDTLACRENHEFLSYIFNNLGDCEIKNKVAAKEIASNAPEYAMPINFLVSK